MPNKYDNEKKGHGTGGAGYRWAIHTCIEEEIKEHLDVLWQ